MATIIDFLRNPSGRGAFEAHVTPHMDHLYRVAYRFTGSRPDAEDLVQDVLLHLYPHRRRMAAVEQLRPWLTRVLYHRFIDNTRRARHDPLHRAAGDEEAERQAGPGNPAEDAHRRSLRRRLDGALAELNPDQRVLVALHDMEGYPLPEIEMILGTPIGTLKSRLHRARAKLREALEPEINPLAEYHDSEGMVS